MNTVAVSANRFNILNAHFSASWPLQLNYIVGSISQEVILFKTWAPLFTEFVTELTFLHKNV